MLTKEQILSAVKAGRKSQTLDGRDYSRLVHFFGDEHLEAFDYGLKEGAPTREVKEFTEENVLKQLEADVAFGFEKALNQRGISAGLMHAVVLMWMWVLEDQDLLAMEDDYAQYGLPLFKAVAVKYGFENEIGDDYGNEDTYASD